MTAQEQLDGIKPGDKLVVMMGFSNDLTPQEGEVLVILVDGFILVKFPEGILYANTWLVPRSDDYMGGKAVLNPMHSEDCVEAPEQIMVHQINEQASMDETYEGALLEIISINGERIQYDS